MFTTTTSDVKLAEDALTIFPNPADVFITATIKLEEMVENATFTIYNINGQVIETRNLSNVTNEQVLFDLEGYTSGVYFMTTKNVKQRQVPDKFGFVPLIEEGK